MEAVIGGRGGARGGLVVSMCSLCFLLLGLLICMPNQSHALTIEGSISTTEAFTYIGKFTYRDLGDLRWEISKESDLTLYLFLDEEWDMIVDMIEPRKCYHRFSKARSSVSLSTRSGSTTVSQWIRPHVWYIVLGNKNDCELERRYELDYKLTLLNPGENHFSDDESGMLLFHEIVFLAMIVYSALYYIRLKKVLETEGSIHPILIIFTVALVLQMGSVFSKTMHLFIFSYDGYGVYLFKATGELLEAGSQIVIMFLFIVISRGWTVSNTVMRSNMVTLVLGVLALIELCLVILGHAYDGSYSKYHAHETIPGIFLVLIRVGLGIWFLVSLRMTLENERAFAKRKFYSQFAMFALMWFAAFPLVMLTAKIFAPYLRHKVVTYGVFIMQLVAVMLLSTLFFSEKSLYHKVSTLSSSPLPSMNMVNVRQR